MNIPRAVVFAAVCLILGSVGVRDASAYDVWFMITYDVSLATGETGDFVGDPGWRGFGVQGWSFRSPRLSWGFVTGWHNFYEKTAETFQIENVTISGTQARFLDAIPALVGVNYHFGDRGYRVRPYLGVKGGAYWISHRVEIGTVNVIINRKWHLGVAPEAGITFLTPDLEFYGFLSADYNHAFSRDDSIDYTYLSLSIGFVYIL